MHIRIYLIKVAVRYRLMRSRFHSTLNTRSKRQWLHSSNHSVRLRVGFRTWVCNFKLTLHWTRMLIRKRQYSANTNEGLVWQYGGVSVDLPAGDYHVWFTMEDAGYWEYFPNYWGRQVHFTYVFSISVHIFVPSLPSPTFPLLADKLHHMASCNCICRHRLEISLKSCRFP